LANNSNLIKLFTAFTAICFLGSSALGENGISSDKILIGTSIGLSGRSAQKAQQIKIGTDLVIDKVNKSGGVNGRKIDISYLDNSYDPKTAAEQTLTFIKEKKVFCLFGFYSTGIVRATLPLSEKAGVPYIAPILSDEFVHDPEFKMAFPVRASSRIEIEKLAQLIKTLGMKKIGLLYQTDGTGQAARAALMRAFHDLHLKLAADVGVPRDVKDVSPMVSQLVKADVDAVIAAANFETVSNFISAAAESGYRPTYFTTTTSTSPELAQVIRKQKADVYSTLELPSLLHKNSLLLQEYLKDAKEAGVPPETSQLLGYVGARVLVEGLKRAGTNPTRQSLITGLESMSDFKVGEIPIIYKPGAHLGSSSIFLLRATKGEYAALEEDFQPH
jgi:branched-chain amino acid transport system substrate-binding protein